MGRDRAAYMREYRARKRAASEADESIAYTSTVLFHDASKRILELEAEVRHLKAELAKRPSLGQVRVALKGARGLALDSEDSTLDAELEQAINVVDRFNSRPFTPVPKTRK